MCLNNEELAKDLVQETFLAAPEKINQFKGNSTESTWLIAILKNKVVDLYRENAFGFNKKISVKEAEDKQQDEPTGFVYIELKISASDFWVIIHRTKLNLRASLQKNWA